MSAIALCWRTDARIEGTPIVDDCWLTNWTRSSGPRLDRECGVLITASYHLRTQPYWRLLT